jgi:lipopolysaccharide biosynthesis glycosyltransferase
MTISRSIWIGYDPREAEAFAAFRQSIRMRLNLPIPIYGLVLDRLRADGLYWRETTHRDNKLWDEISGAPMATEFAISRFLVPHLAKGGQALFMDCDMLARTNIGRLFDICDDSKAVWCVKHDHQPSNALKMDGQAQTRYARKNWSSVMMFTAHPANKALTPELVNQVPGRDLHRFCWLEDDQIGELSPEWNFLVGHTDPSIDPNIVHFTDGGPWMAGYENVPFADEWFRERDRWAA